MDNTGVSLAFLKQFHAQLFGTEAGQPPAFDPATLTTTEACDKFVKRLTAERQCAYIDLFRHQQAQQQPPLFAPANVFVSHAWRYAINDSLQVMIEYGEQHPNTYFWFDLLVNNQHKAVDLPQEWWRDGFQRLIGGGWAQH